MKDAAKRRIKKTELRGQKSELQGVSSETILNNANNARGTDSFGNKNYIDTVLKYGYNKDRRSVI